MASDSDTSDLLKVLMQTVKGFAPEKLDVMGFKPPKGSNKKSTVAHLDSLRREGTRFFKDGNYIAAMNLYSQCIVQSGETMENVENLNNSDEERAREAAKVKKILFLALSNRAETWLRLEDYHRALKDADRALESEPNHAKCLVRRGKSLEGLQRYEEACTCFKAALEQVPNLPLVQVSLRRCLTCYQQCHKGNFDLSNCEGEALDPCCEFVGPIEIQMRLGDDGYGGRGVFLTESAVAGQLLLVSNALAVVRGDPTKKHPIKAMEEYWVSRATNTIEEKEDDLALRLSFCACGSAELKAKLGSLFSGSERMDIPAMELFKPGAEWSPICLRRCSLFESNIKDHKDMVDRIRKVVKYNAFTDFDDLGRAYSGCSGREEYLKSGCGGLWLLPSFLNHSCTPNCNKVYIGNSVFVRASRAMAAGEELSLAYCDVSLSVESRRNRLRKWGFECECRRCLAEASF